MICAVLLIILLISFGEARQLELSEEMNEIIQHVHNECVSKSGATEEDIKNCEDGIFKEDMKLKCYMYCLMETANLIHDDGTVDYDTLMGVIPEQYSAKVRRMVEPCVHVDSPDKERCQGAFDFQKCAYSRDPELYFLF